MHTGTCQHVDPVRNGTPAQNRAIPACRACAEPMSARPNFPNRALEGLDVLRDYSGSDGLVNPWPKFTIEGQR